MTAGVAIQILQPFATQAEYSLSSVDKNIVGSSRDDTAQYLKLNSTDQAYEFALPDSSTPVSSDSQKNYGRNDNVYSTSLSLSAKNGISYTDTNTKITVSVTPQFDTADAQKVDGDHIVYPAGADQLVYTHKYNGLKEDILVPSYRANQLSYKFKLSLPVGVEARLDGQGNIGIYSADASLFGNISFGSDKDRTAIDKARENGEKTNLVATIPYPVVKDAAGHEYNDRASFSLSAKTVTQSKSAAKDLPPEVAQKQAVLSSLNTYQLSIATKNIQDLDYPISVDPTIQASAASDFLQGTGDSGIDFDATNNLIKRSSLKGGSINTWTTDGGGNFSNTRYMHGVVASNGYIYVIGGCQNSTANCAGNMLTDVSFAALNASDGSIGSWSTTTAIPTALMGLGAVAYNGYVYIAGGTTDTDFNNAISTVRYAKIKTSDGTLGSWTATTSMPVSKAILSLEAYNGYLYSVGGRNSASLTDVRYAPINGDGSIGSWTAGSSLGTARGGLSAAVYNGYIYALGGNINGGNLTNTTEYAPIKSDGSLGTWTAGPSFTTSRFGLFGYATNGYIYMGGGCTATITGIDCSALGNDVQYAQLSADGSMAAWATTSGFSTARAFTNGVAANGYVYVLGGTTNTSFTTSVADSQYSSISPVGEPRSFGSAGGNFATARQNFGTIAYGGYLYVMGGDNGGATRYQDIQYTKLTSTGTYSTPPGCGSTWCTTTQMPAVRNFVQAVAYNGVMYISGGQGLAGAFFNEIRYATINSDGSLGAWTSTNAYSGNRVNYAFVQSKGYLYIFGGWDGSANRSDCQYAQITSPTVAAWSTCSASMTVGTANMTAAAYGGYIYWFGGSAGGSATNAVYYAQPNSSGNITAWTATTNLPAASNYPRATVANGMVYLIGGSNSGGTPQTSVVYGAFNSDGTISSWQTAGHNMGTARQGGGAASAQGYIFAVGSSSDATSESTLFNNGGSGATGSWTTSAQTMNARSNHRVLALNGYIYVLGGACTGIINGCSSSISGQVQYAAVNTTTGDIGTWSAASNGITARMNAAAFTYNGRLYVLGGCSNSACNAYTRTIQYATPAANGDITSAWTTNASNLPSDNVGVAMIAYEGYVYRVGGNVNAAGATSTTDYTTIATNGTVGGSWTTGTSLNQITANNRLLTNNGYIYTVGGQDGSVELGTIEYSKIQADHSLGTWNLTTPIVGARQALTAVVSNGFIYAIGGYRSGANRLSDTEYAPIAPDGSLGTWQTSTSMNVVKADTDAVIVRGKVYVPGGSDNTGAPLNDTQYASLSIIPRTGAYSRLIDFDKGVNPTKIITRGTQLTDALVSVSYSTTNNTASSYTNTQSATGILYGGANAVATTLGSGVSIGRYLLLTYTIDDSASALFPDSAGGQTTITDYDLYFTANPSSRLRGGQTFTGQKDRGLSAAQ